MRTVINETRSERTARLLVARLEALAHVASQLRHVEAERLVELATVATMRAVALELIQAERADAIWRDAHIRHPELPQVEIALPERLAA
jgi:ubiquinone biosynthesis protein COQ9